MGLQQGAEAANASTVKLDKLAKLTGAPVAALRAELDAESSGNGGGGGDVLSQSSSSSGSSSSGGGGSSRNAEVQATGVQHGKTHDRAMKRVTDFEFRSQDTVCGLSFLVLLLNKHIREEEAMRAFRAEHDLEDDDDGVLGAGAGGKGASAGGGGVEGKGKNKSKGKSKGGASARNKRARVRLRECKAMSKSEFVSQCLSIGEQGEMRAEALAAIYESLLSRALAVPQRLSAEPSEKHDEIDVLFEQQEAFGIKLRADEATGECVVAAFQDFGQAERGFHWEMEEGQTRKRKSNKSAWTALHRSFATH